MPTALPPRPVVRRRSCVRRPKAIAPRSSTRPKVRPAGSPPFWTSTARPPEVTRKRLYLEAMEEVLGDVNKVIVDGEAGSGVLPYLPLNQLAPGSAGQSNQ